MQSGIFSLISSREYSVQGASHATAYVPMDLRIGPIDLSTGPMDLSFVCPIDVRVPSSFNQAASAMLISPENEPSVSVDCSQLSTGLLPHSHTENENNQSEASTGNLISTSHHSTDILEEILPTSENSDFAFVSPRTDSRESISITIHETRAERELDTNNTIVRPRILSVTQQRRDENVHIITKLVLSEENRNNRYTGYMMLLQFAQAVENNIYSAVNGEGDYSQYFTATISVIQRTFQEWKRDNPNKQFSVWRDLFGMNMQDFINNASPRCASILSNPPGLSNSNTSTGFSNPVTIPGVSNTVTTLSSEVTLEVNQLSVSAADGSNENQRNNNRFDPYQLTSLTFLRTPRRQRMRHYTRTYSVCFYCKSILPLRVNRSSLCCILETVIDILLDDGEDVIRGKLVGLLLVKHGYHHITGNDLVFLKSARRELDLPVSPPEFQWNGDKIRRLIGSGKLHIMVQIERIIDSSFSTSCLIDICERNDPRRRQFSVSSSSLMPRPQPDHHISAGNDLVESMDEEAVAEAIRGSIIDPSQQFGQNATDSLEEIKVKITRALREHSGRVVKGFKRYITIKREDLWNSALEFFKMPNFCKQFGTLSVKFQIQDGITEEASDFSGPKREFFRLLISEICRKSGALVETPNGLVPRNNIRQLQEGVLRHIGRMISTIVLQGGEAPAIFSPVITQCILNDPVSTKTSVDDIPDLVIRESLKLVKQADDQESLEKALSSCDWRFDVDGLPLFVKMENKEDFIQASSMYFAILQRQTGIQQLLQGFEYYGFLELMKRKPFICSVLEYNKNDVCTKDLLYMLKPQYSFTISRREKEEKLFSNLKEFLQLVEDKTLLHRLASEFADSTTEEREFVSTMKPSKLLEFCTGSSKIPVMGFAEDPHVTFSHVDEKFHPSAHTCGNKLVMYVNDKTVNDKSQFFKIMVETLMNAEHFGFG